jgi:phosphate:Na+ symporter
MNLLNILQALGGLGLFLYGMQKMSESLRKSSSEKIRTILAHLTKNRVIALLTGTAATCLIQSSSATTIMTVGLVNAGLLTIRQAISVVLGANIGTTLTAWIVSLIGKFSIAAYALPIIAIGFFMMTLAKKEKVKNIGQILFGFGLIFFGLDIMKDIFAPIKQSETVLNLFAQFSKNPLLGILVGTIFTILFQSSSATIAIIQILAFNGIIGFEAAIPIILGDNIGTTITAELATFNTNTAAKQTARAHTLFNVLGTAFILPFAWIGLYPKFIEFIFPGPLTKTNIMMHIALAHSLFNIINACIFTIFIDSLVKLAKFLSFEKIEEKQTTLLEEHLLDNPAIALEQVIKELVNMAKIAKDVVAKSQTGYLKENKKLLEEVDKDERLLDDTKRAIIKYMIKISEKQLDAKESLEYPALLRCATSIEKIGNYAQNIVKYTKYKIEKKLKISKFDEQTINKMFDYLYELFDLVIDAMQHKDHNKATQAIKIEDKIDEMKLEIRENYIKEVQKKGIDPVAKLFIIDISSNIEKIGDHLTVISKNILKDFQWGKKINIDLG